MIFAGPKRGRPTPGFQFLYVCLDVRLFVDLSLRSNFGPYTFFKGQRDKGTTQELGDLGTWELGNLGTWELGNLGTWELKNLGT